MNKTRESNDTNRKISVITPSFNSGDTIERAIKSVLEQDYKNWEHIIIDGASTDNTIEILKSYHYIKWISEPDKGQAYAMNKGFLKSTGDIIVYLDADDYFFPGAFSRVMKEFKKDADFVVGNVLVKSARMKYEFINYPRITLEGMLRHWEPNAFSHNPVGYFYIRLVQEKCPFNVENHDTMDLEFLLDAASKFKFTKVEYTLGCFEDSFNTKTGRYQSRLDYWQPSSFPYIDKYLSTFSDQEKLVYQRDRRQGYALMQGNMNLLYESRIKILKQKEIPLVSFIIPTYNCKEYISRAIKSIFDQKLKNVEIIIIDDGSTDGTDLLLKQQYSKNHEIRIIKHKHNQRNGFARNEGLDIAKGEYIFFLDADDWLEPQTLVTLISIAEEYSSEIVACGINMTWDDGRKERYHSFSLGCEGGIDGLYHLAEYRIASTIWNKLYLREFIEKNNLRFVYEYYHEDVIFSIHAIYKCKNYISIPDLFCNYFQRENSIVHSKPTVQHLRSYINLYRSVTEFIKKNKLSGTVVGQDLSKLLLHTHCTNNVFVNLLRYVSMHSQEEWKADCVEACYQELGIGGYALADLIIEVVHPEMNQSGRLRSELNAVYSSRGWRTIVKFRAVVNRFLPHLSIRRKIAKNIYMAAKGVYTSLNSLKCRYFDKKVK